MEGAENVAGKRARGSGTVIGKAAAGRKPRTLKEGEFVYIDKMANPG